MIFNPAFATYRMNVTADTHLSRVVGAWAMSSKLVQPACIAAAGLLAATAGIRTAIAVLAVVLLACPVLMPWTALRPAGRTAPLPALGIGRREYLLTPAHRSGAGQSGSDQR